MNKQTHTIAVIDDNRGVRESLVSLLGSFGYRANSFNSAEQFLGSSAFSITSCIITDVEMQGMSGLGLLQYLKDSDNPVPVIIITGKPSDRTGSLYLRNGAIGFLRKPVDGESLVELVKSISI